MKKILCLPSWFPNRLEPLNGDFLARHAMAASLYNKITVLYLVKNRADKTIPKYSIEEKKFNDNFSARILYYKPFSRIKAVESVFAGIRYCIFLAELIRHHIREDGKPDLIHVQVAWRAGLLALYARWKYKLRYVVSEQWTVFIPGAIPGFEEKNFIAKHLIRSIYKHAHQCSAVSAQLAGALRQRFPIEYPLIIPNIVDTTLFHSTEKNNETFRFIHISEFNYQKNPEQLFEAIAILKNMRAGLFELAVFAPDEKVVTALAVKHGIEGLVKFKGYVPHDVLAKEMGRSDALILYSHFETFGCVVIEAMASGIPVIVSDIPVMHEIVRDGTGVIVPLHNPSLLAEKMLWMINNKQQFDPAWLALYAAQHYSFEKAGSLFDELYEKAIQ